MIDADLLVLVSDIDALYDAPPTQAGAKAIHEVTDFADIAAIEIGGAGSAGVGSGGMVTKIEAARIATGAGISMLLTSLEQAGQSIAGAELGTYFQGQERKTTSRLLWLAHAATPQGKWAPTKEYVELAKSIAKKSGGTVEVIHDADEAARGASVLYTDVWMSMGDSESDRKEKVAALSPFSVTDSLMAATEKDSIFMHCLPAHRGEEVSASVIDGPRSVIWREAYHRRTTIQALLYHLSRGELVGSK